jgi:hypothetical protein
MRVVVRADASPAAFLQRARIAMVSAPSDESKSPSDENKT